MLEITSKAKLFALSQITPKAKEIDEKQEFPSQIFKELANEGFFKTYGAKRVWRAWR